MQQSIQKRIQKPAHHADRRGATLVEAVICILAFLTLVLGMLDLGITVSRYNTVAEAARLGARMAIVHGSKSLTSFAGGPWDGTNDGDALTAIHKKIDPLLEAQGVVSGDITLEVKYSDRSPADYGDSNSTTNDPAVTTAGDTVTVTVSIPHTTLMTFIFGVSNSNAKLTGKSTMGIAH